MNTRIRILATLALLFIALTYLFAWSPVFSVRQISTEGLPAGVSSEAIISKSKIFIGEKLSRIEPRSIERSLGELSWVKSVAIERDWMHGHVNVSITARTPVGIYNGKALDSAGTIFELPGKRPNGLPIVSAASPALGLTAIELFTRLPISVQESILTVSASTQSSITSWHQLKDRKIKVMWGSAAQIDLKVSVLQALLELPENAQIKRVDLSAPHAPIVK